ncbi:hypothetical protein B0H10DRAFT_2197237 [Mycena sp. CBHHK59/15]|nr:hypothetical protein B0H10DRAFT_2197237 [Mycena sp. CBHHK59/15]
MSGGTESAYSTEKFVPLGAHAYIQRGTPLPSSTVSETGPTVVLMCGWMSAKLPHLHKYTAVYRELYPHVTIVLVRSHISAWYIPYQARQARLQPVSEALKALGCLDGAQKPRILTHTFSNGGSLQLVALASLLSQTRVTPRIHGALIVDSSPGGDTLEKLQLATTSPIKNFFLKLLANGLIRVMYCIMWTVGHIIRRANPIRTMTAALSSPRVLPWLDERSPRLYIYSKADKMVPWTDVEAHVDDAAHKGVNARKLHFDDSPHVAHARAHPEEYWAAVKKVWADACLASE